jgi:hypothetical protein
MELSKLEQAVEYCLNDSLIRLDESLQHENEIKFKLELLNHIQMINHFQEQLSPQYVVYISGRYLRYKEKYENIFK